MLVEKPSAVNHSDAMGAIVEAAIRNDVFLMEAFMYRCHPQTAKVSLELVRNEEIGEVRGHIRDVQLSLAAKTFDANSRLLSNDLAGRRGILDAGCYPTSMSRLIAGRAAVGRRSPIR